MTYNEGFLKTGRIGEFPEPSILICPQCGDILECTSKKGKCYCFGCDVMWERGDVKQMIRYGDSEPIPFKEEK